MKKEYLKVISDCDGLSIGAVVIEPEDKEDIRGVVQLSHGMAEHKERYYPFMEFLAEKGFASVINDHRGHGQSVKSKEDWGYFSDDTAEYAVEDLHQITCLIKEKFPNKSICLFGHSMGSLIVRKYIKKYDTDIAKLVVCGSPSKNPMVGAALLLVKLQTIFKGDRYRSSLIQKLAFGNYNSSIENPVSENAWLSADEENVRAYDNDEACGFVFTLNGFKNLFMLMKQVYSSNGWKLGNKKLPIMFIAGADDPVIVNEKSWRESMKFLETVGYENVTGKLYKGLRHEILNETESAVIYEDILTFIKK